MNKLQLTDELIQDRLNSIIDRDKYGQRMIFDQRLNSILPEFSKEEIQEFCKTSDKFRCSLYGGRVGQYYAIVKK